LKLSNFTFSVSDDGLNWTIAPAATGLAATVRSSDDESDIVTAKFLPGSIAQQWVRAHVGTNLYAHTSDETFVVAASPA
jgi:hypothetical protein